MPLPTSQIMGVKKERDHIKLLGTKTKSSRTAVPTFSLHTQISEGENRRLSLSRQFDMMTASYLGSSEVLLNASVCLLLAYFLCTPRSLPFPRHLIPSSPCISPSNKSDSGFKH